VNDFIARVMGLLRRSRSAFTALVARRLRRIAGPRVIQPLFFSELIEQTDNFHKVRWLGHPILQNILDLWVIQETIAEIRPAVLLETGTNRGGSALFYAHMFDLLGSGRVVTVDIERMHELEHPRITALTGSSLSTETLSVMREHAEAATGPVMVILDSDHAEAHVRAELDAYSNFVTPGSFLLAQDGVIDTLRCFTVGRPGPLPAIRSFLATHADFEVDEERSRRFLISHHPSGWLRRTTA
jgi:cephalosporin hydroxylase